jgi:hypothetical protein
MGGGCFFCSPEDLLNNNNANYTYITIKSSLKVTFLWQTPDNKKFAEIFCEAYLIFKEKYIGICAISSVVDVAVFSNFTSL